MRAGLLLGSCAFLDPGLAVLKLEMISPSLTIKMILLLQSPESMLTFEGEQFKGSQAIVEKLTKVGRVQHDVKSMDVQPSQNPSAIIIFVTGTLRIDGGNPLHFCEVFQLVSTGPGA